MSILIFFSFLCSSIFFIYHFYVNFFLMNIIFSNFCYISFWCSSLEGVVKNNTFLFFLIFLLIICLNMYFHNIVFLKIVTVNGAIYYFSNFSFLNVHLNFVKLKLSRKLRTVAFCTKLSDQMHLSSHWLMKISFLKFGW